MIHTPLLCPAPRRTLPALAALACALAAPSVRAQIAIKSNGAAVTQPITFGLADCQLPRSLAFSWDLGSTYQGSAVTVVATATQPTANAACPAGKSVATTFGKTSSASVTVTDFITAAAVDGGVSSGCSTASTSASPGAGYFCISFPVAGTLGSTTYQSAFATVNYALQPPGAPVSLSTSPGDGHVKLTWSPASSADQIDRYEVYAVTAGAPIDPARPVQSSSGTANADVPNLVNGTAYDFAVLARDIYGNQSAVSARATGTPTRIDDFYNRYRSAGGGAAGGGGCSTGGGTGAVGLLALALLALRLGGRGRGRARSGAARGALLGALVVAAASPARADLGDLGARAREPAPRRLLVAVKVDRYDPQIDAERGLTGTPYRDIFRGRAPLRWQLEADWEAFHPFGSILFGGTIGFWQNIGRGIVNSSGVRSDDTALLDILPLGAIATYRFDWVADRVPWLPVIPYAQAGLTAALWTSFAGNGSVSRNATPGQGGRGSGWSYGYTTALGVALALDVLTPGISNEGRVDFGFKRSALFAEYGWTRLDNFRRGRSLILSDRAWRFGLSVEF
ncbi:MAG: hypothetical protein NVSMB23_19640 [Myxococcales bacterium]